MDIKEFVTLIKELVIGMTGLIAGVVPLVVPTTKLIHETTRLLKWWLDRRRAARTNTNRRVAPHPRPSRASILWIVVPIIVSVAILGYRHELWVHMPLDERLTRQAWDALNKHDYERAIGYADECTGAFKGGADREQSQLAQENVPLPPTGRVSDQEREMIWRRGPLNATATSLFIQGKALEVLRQKQQAVSAYREASRYTYARCWDRKTKIFWSPAEAAMDRLKVLGE